MPTPHPKTVRRRRARRAGTLWTSGWKALFVLFGAPLVFFVFLYYAVHFVFWGLARGSEYRSEQAPFIGVGSMVGLNLALPGVGLMAGGFAFQGSLCLSLWVIVFLTAIRYAALPTRNLTVMHLFAGIWASVVAGFEVYRLTRRPSRLVASRRGGRVNVFKQRVPTLEDPDLYPVRLELFQLLLEAAAGASEDGRFAPVQKAAINRLRHLLRIEEHAFGKLLRQVTGAIEVGESPGKGARMGREAVFDRVIEQGVDHAAFTGLSDSLIDTAANLLGIPLREARGRRIAYERGEQWPPTSETTGTGIPYAGPTLGSTSVPFMGGEMTNSRLGRSEEYDEPTFEDSADVTLDDSALEETEV